MSERARDANGDHRSADYYTVVFQVGGTRGYTDPYTHQSDAERKRDELRETEGVSNVRVFDYQEQEYTEDDYLLFDGVCPVCGEEFVDGFEDVEEGTTLDARICIVEHAPMIDHGVMLVHLEEDDGE